MNISYLVHTFWLYLPATNVIRSTRKLTVYDPHYQTRPNPHQTIEQDNSSYSWIWMTLYWSTSYGSSTK